MILAPLVRFNYLNQIQKSTCTPVKHDLLIWAFPSKIEETTSEKMIIISDKICCHTRWLLRLNIGLPQVQPL